MSNYSNILPDYRIWVDNVSDIDILLDSKNNYANPKLTIGNIIYVSSEDTHYCVTGTSSNVITGYRRLADTNSIDQTITMADINAAIANKVNPINTKLNNTISSVSIECKNSKLYLKETRTSGTSVGYSQIPVATQNADGLLSKTDKQNLDSAVQDIAFEFENSTIKLEKQNNTIILPVYSEMPLDNINDNTLITGIAVKQYIDTIIQSISEGFFVTTAPNEKNIETYSQGNTTYIKSTNALNNVLELAKSAVQKITTGSDQGTINVDSKNVKVYGWDNLQNTINNIESNIETIENSIENIDVSDSINSKLEELTYTDNAEKYKFVTSVSQQDGKISVTKSEVDIRNSCNILYIPQLDYDTQLSLNNISKNTIYVIIDNTGEPIRIYIGELLFADKKEDNTAFPYNFPMIF